MIQKKDVVFVVTLFAEEFNHNYKDVIEPAAKATGVVCIGTNQVPPGPHSQRYVQPDF